MWFVSLMHGTDKIVHWLSSYEGIMPFRVSKSEQPHINYRNMPIRGLYELTRLNDYLQKNAREIHCPVAMIQSTDDPVDYPNSGKLLYCPKPRMTRKNS
jgi:hypothetical protein